MQTKIILGHLCPLFQKGLQTVVEQDSTLCLIGATGESEQLLDLARLQQPDVVIVDGNLPDAFGVVEGLNKTGSCAPLVFAPSPDEETFFQFFRVGARAYIDSMIPDGELLDTIHRLACGECLIHGERFERLSQPEPMAEHLPPALEEDSEPSESVAPLLTARETDVLRYIAAGYSNKEIALTICISDQTIKNHITRILKKMNVSDRTAAVVSGLRTGLIQLDSLPPSRPERPRDTPALTVQRRAC